MPWGTVSFSPSRLAGIAQPPHNQPEARQPAERAHSGTML